MECLKTIRWTGRGSRGSLFLLASLCLLTPGILAASGLHRAQQEQQQPPAPIERRPPSLSNRLPSITPTGDGYGPAPERLPGQGAPGSQGARVERRDGIRGEHLAQWMDQHRNLTPEQQQQALTHEPGFNSLPEQTQRRYRDDLARLNAMSPEQRQRALAHIEMMERLTLPQRAEVRSAMGQLGSLPPDQRAGVAREFRALRELPPEQRVPAMNSGRFGPPLNDAQRAALNHLLRVAPLLYPQAGAGGDGPPPGQPGMPQ